MDITVALYVLICISLVYFTCRFVLPLLVMVGLRKVLKININIGKIGLLSFYDVKIKVKPGLTVEAGYVAICSSYISSCYKNPLTLHFAQLRVQVDVEDLQSSNKEKRLKNGKPPSRKKILKKLFKKVSRFQFCGVHLEDLDVFITTSFLPDSLLLIHLQHLHGECTVTRDRLNTKVELKELNYRVVQGGQPTGRCVSDGGLCMSVVMDMILIDGCLWPQEFDINLDSFESHIRKDISTRAINFKLRKISAKGEFVFENDLEEITGKMETKLFDLKVVSEVANILNLTSSTLQLQLSESQVMLKVESNGLFIGYHHDDVWPLVTALDMMLLKRTIQKQPVVTRSNISPPKVRQSSVAGILSKKGIEARVNMDHSSFAIATSVCPGVKGGFVTARVALVLKPNHGESQKQLIQRDGRFEAELTSVYLKQTEGGVSYTELQANYHQWNSNVFVGTVFLRGNKLEQSVAIDTMLDSCQLEISPKCSLVMSKILDAMLKSRSSHLTEKERLIQNLKHNAHTAENTENDCNESFHQNQKYDSSEVGGDNCDLGELDQGQYDLKEEEEGEFYECSDTGSQAPRMSNTLLRHKLLRLAAPNFWCDVVESNHMVKKERSKPASDKLDITWNLQLSGMSVFFCHEKQVCCVLRVDSIYSDVRTDYAQVRVTDIKLSYCRMDPKGHPILRCSDLTKYHLYLKTLEGEYSLNRVKHKRAVLVQFYDELYMEWSMALHLCLLGASNDISDLVTTVTQYTVFKPQKPVQSGKVRSPLVLTVEVKTHTSLALELPESHRVTFLCPGFEVKKKQDSLKVHCKKLVVAFDDLELLTVEGIEITYRASCDEISVERRHLTQLEKTSNRTVTIRLESLNLVFPYMYNFDKCFRQLIGLNKWRKIVHKKQKKAFTVDSLLPSDLFIQVQQVTVQLSDDPFEVKLGDNYELLLDENIEHSRRVATLETKIPELMAKHGFLTASKIEELHATLNKKSSMVYIQRSRALYSNAPMRTKLLTLTIENLEVMAMADKTLHGKEYCLHHMRDIDPSSPYPNKVVDYSTLFCRMVNVAATEVKIQLRDYPVPMLEVRDLHLWGRLVGAEEVGLPKAKRTATIELADPWGSISVTKNMPPLKFYHDFSCDIGLWNMAYGPCWEPVISYVSLAMDLINKPSVDPSPSLPFWDKARLLIHGQLTMCVSSMSWRYHASFDPYNKEEFMDWTWTDLVLDWTNAKWILKGDLDIYARTASKYDDCCVLHLPNLKLCVQLDWCCQGNPNAHHLVQPTAPEKIPVDKLNGWDSYKDFRSSHLNLEISFETKPQEGRTSRPQCKMYASMIRWLDRVKMCIDRLSRPVRKGRLFGSVKPKKKSLSRHYKKFQVSFKVHKYEIHYWVSYVQKIGIEVHGQSFALLSGLEQTICSGNTDQTLVRRPRSEWSVRQLGVEQNNVCIWLCTTRKEPDISSGNEADSVKTDKESPPEKHKFLSVKTVLYQRAEETVDKSIMSLEQSLNDESDTPSHHVQVYELRGLWTPHNRNIVLSLYDGYRKSSTLRKNLSTEALKGFKVDTQLLSPPRNSRPTGSGSQNQSEVFTPSPVSRLQAGPGFDMLKKLVSESDTKFIAVHEEISGGNVQVDQLTGVTACQRDDVVRKEWQVELHNSQVMLKGCETPGYVIVSAAKASILTCDHRPIWRDQELLSKNSIVGSLDCMQYYATINPERKIDEIDLDSGSVRMSHDEEDQPIAWLSNENIEDQQENVQSIMGIEGMLGSGQMVGGIVNEKIEQEETGQTATTTSTKHVQLQRIISRCKCQIFYAGYGEVDDDSLIEVAAPCGGGEGDSGRGAGVILQVEEGVDCLTLLHHDLNICTNSSQYEMILDVVNNLLLFVDSKQKEREERQQRLKFKLHLNSISDQKTPVVHRQNQLRGLVSRVRQLEREAYLIQREVQESGDDMDLILEQEELEKKLAETKDLVNTASEGLATLISAFKETQLQAQAELRATLRKDDALPVKVYEVCFKHAAWRMTEEDGQIGIADVMLRNFLYTKLNKDDDSGSHQMELGYLKVTNLLPDSTYKDLVGLQEGGKHVSGLGPSDRQTMLRVLCKFKAPVGGIPIKEHLEVNVLPVTLQLTKKFYNAAMQFFFPERKKETSEHHKDSDGKKKRLTVDAEAATRWHVDDIDKMKERAAKNNVFLYVKIPEVPLTVSYKGLKDKNVTDVHNFQFVVPTLEYHSKTWTWLDLLLAMKNDCKKVLIAQAIKQKLHMRSRVAELCEMVQHGEALQEEEDKASMLLGSRVLGDKPVRKNLFGKSPKH